MEKIQKLYSVPIQVTGNIIVTNENSLLASNQDQTKDIFSDKWTEAEKIEDIEKLYAMQYEWFLSLYSFKDEQDLIDFLADKEYILDTGCGLGYKAAWFAKLAPHATVIGIDISDAPYIAARNFSHLPNLYFTQGDIANTLLNDESMDFVVCDQVIMHTEVPEETFQHLSNITKKSGQFACYVYRKKALPRELIDDYFRTQTHNIAAEEMWELSSQLTILGQRLSELNVSFESPDIPVLGIKGGTYDIQRFIYWNFLKCFWKEDWGFELSKVTNYDWYAPSNAKRFSRQEFEHMIFANNLVIASFHEEEACYSARLFKASNRDLQE